MTNILESLTRATDESLGKLHDYAQEAYLAAKQYGDQPQEDFWAAVVACVEIELQRRCIA